jgi:hypothetical protein
LIRTFITNGAIFAISFAILVLIGAGSAWLFLLITEPLRKVSRLSWERLRGIRGAVISWPALTLSVGIFCTFSAVSASLAFLGRLRIIGVDDR